MKIEDSILLKVESDDIENGTVIIPNYVKRIGYHAFQNCTSLTAINIPDTIIFIDAYAFEKCTNLQTIHMSDSVTHIEPYAFAYCENLRKINIPKNIKYIGLGAFYECSNLIKKGNYKICEIIQDKDNVTYSCDGTIFEIGKQMPIYDNVDDWKRGYHYCENFYQVFNYCGGDFNDIALFEVELGDIVKKYSFDTMSKHCVTNTIKLIRQIPWNEAFDD